MVGIYNDKLGAERHQSANDGSYGNLPIFYADVEAYFEWPGQVGLFYS
jgi:hypothetical protein